MFEEIRTQLLRGVRSAAITARVSLSANQLAQDNVSARKDDLGFVPLLHVAGDWRLTSRWQLGTDIDEAYSFAWVHYGVASVVWRW